MNKSTGKGAGYVRLNLNEDAEASTATGTNPYLESTFQQQQNIMEEQDQSLDRIGNSMRSLKNMSHQIGNELDSQSEVLDELGTSISVVDARMNDVMKKLAKLTRLEDDSRQWTAIFVLIGLIVVLLIVLVIL